MGRLGEFYRYFIPGEKPNYVMLRTCNIYGYMETGKSVLSRKIGARIEEECEKRGWGFLFVEGRRQQDILQWLEEHKDEIKGLDYIMLLYDDAGRFFMSREGTTKERRETLKDYMEIRHIFEEYGFKRGTVGILFNIQFYRLLDKTMRNAPMSIWKSIVIMDPEDRREFVKRVGWRYYYFIKVITKAMFIDDYKLKVSDIKVRSSSKREEIYNWLKSFFEKYGVNPLEKIDSQFVKRFALVELFDDKFIIDTKNDIVAPRNYVKVDYDLSGENDYLPRTKEERDKILYWVGLTYVLFNDPDAHVSERLFIKILRRMGLRFRTETFVKIKDRAGIDLYSDPEILDMLSS